MKSRLTPLAKLLIVIVVIGGIAFGLYKSGLISKIAPKGKTTNNDEYSDDIKDETIIRIGVNTWGGFAGGQYFNEGFKASKESRFLKDYGFIADFKLLDDFNQCREAWKTDQIDVMYATVDGFVTEVGGLKEFEPQVIFQCDWSRGGDAIVVRRGINGVADLEGKKVAFAEMTASHTFLLWMLEAGGLDYSKIIPVKVSSGLEAADLFKKEQVDAAVVWSPDDADCVAKVAGSKVLQSTKQASNIIADVFVAKKKFIEKNKKVMKGLVEGFLKGNAELNASDANRKKASKILAEGMQQPEDFCYQAITNVRLCTYGDNVNFFNLKGNYTGVTGEDIYNQMSLKYSKAGYPTANVPTWRMVSNSSLLADISLSGPDNAAEENAKFNAPTDANKTAGAITTKRASISFASGSYTLDENAKYIVDHEFVDIAKSFANARIRIEGNTDNTGNPARNKKLSEQRAQAVVDYLIKTYGFDKNRFVIVGNGPDKPVADNGTAEGKARNRRTDFEIIPN
jgi:NitT/TauT family transport system substrate-binding protein